MTSGKATAARERILDLLDSGALKAGDRLPGAREIADETGMSLLTAQAAIKTLESDGLIELRPRLGAFVKEGWQEIAVESNFHHFERTLPWIARFEPLLKARFPELRLTKSFKRGVLEMKTTISLQCNRNDYLDMSGIFREACPDVSPFHSAPFKSFQEDGRLLGVPFIFSPRVIVYNPEIFRCRGCPEPHAKWTWEEFIAAIRALRAAGHPKDRIFNFTSDPASWMSFVLLAGGSLFKPSEPDPVRIDSPETRRGLRLYSQIREELGLERGVSVKDHCGELFTGGGLAMTLMPRELRTWLELRSFKSWSAVPTPSLGQGGATNTQATDLICVRRECKDKALAADFVRFMLSEEVQDFIGAEKYGIPIRISSAEKSLDKELPGDRAFFEQTQSMSAEYNLDSPDLASMIYDGLGAIWRRGADVDAATGELASAIRTYLKVKNYNKRKQWGTHANSH